MPACTSAIYDTPQYSTDTIDDVRTYVMPSIFSGSTGTVILDETEVYPVLLVPTL